jgi:hypothetical protein
LKPAKKTSKVLAGCFIHAVSGKGTVITMRLRTLPILLLFAALGYAQVSPSSEPTSSQATSPANSATPAGVSKGMGLYVKVRLDSKVKVSALKPGDVVEGKLSRAVYSGEKELFAQDSGVRLTVDKLGRRRRVPNDHWPWVVKVFTPRYETYPTFQAATIASPGGGEMTLPVSLLSIGEEVRVQAQGKTKKAAGDADKTSESISKSPQPDVRKKSPGTTLTLEAVAGVTNVPGGNVSSFVPSTATLAAGTQAKIILLGGVSASKSHPGDSFQARLAEPVRLDSRVVLPEGTMFEGMVVSNTRPRWLSRSGSLLLRFTQVTLPGGTATPVVASISGADLDQRSHTRMDPEGNMSGAGPGKMWMLIHAGVATGIAKVMDDGTQLVIEAIASSATDASTAGTARIAAMCVTGVFLVTRHGRDVVLPSFTEMDITFDRPFSLSAKPMAGEKNSTN